MQWQCLICPFKAPSSAAELRWSKALESVRKDIECFFGILQGRFRILKLPLQYRQHHDIDNMFMTCCILHNIIHAFDGRSEWEQDVDWAGVEGRLNLDFAEPGVDFAAVNAQRYRRARRLASDTAEDVESSFYTVRRDLVRHYDCAVRVHGEVQWLRSVSEPVEDAALT
jgi:hypothetical protein